LVAYAPQAARAQSEQLLEFAVEDDAGPWSLRDGSGYANDVVRAAFRAVNVELTLVVVPYARCKLLAEEGRSAACFSMSKLPSLQRTIAFPTTPLFVFTAEYFQGTAKPVRAGSLAALPRGTVVGVVQGYEYPASVYALRDRGVIVLEETASEELNIRKLADGRVALALLNHNDVKTADYMVAMAGLTGRVKPAFRAGVLPSYIGFSRKHPRGLEARALFERGVRLLAANGEMARIDKRWKARVVAQADSVKRAARP